MRKPRFLVAVLETTNRSAETSDVLRVTGLFAGSRSSGPLARITGWLGGDVARWVGIFLLFSIAAVVQTWPLVLHATDSIIYPGSGIGDTGYYLWNLWWIKHALIELQTNPFHTDLVYFPQGVDLYIGGLSLANGVLSIPLQLATGNLILSANVLHLAMLVFSGLAMYALSYRVNHNHLAALVSGMIFAFAPFTLIRIQGGEWNISATWPIPLFAFFLLRFQETARLREAVAVGICWALIIYNWLEYGTDAGLFLGLFMVYWSFILLRRRDWRRLSEMWRGFVAIAAVAFVVSSPLLIQAFRAVYGGSFFLNVGDEFYSGDLLTFVTPSPLWGPGTLPGSPFGSHLPVGSIEGTAYLGIVPLLLAGLALFAVRRTPHRFLFWAAVFLVFAILSLGPYLYVGGTKTLSVFGLSFSVPLPYQLYDQLPVFGSRRIPARMIIFGIMGLSVLAGVGTDLLMAWLRPRYRRILPLAALVVLSLVVLEYWNPPVRLAELSTPAVLEEIRDEPGDFTVLDAPVGRQDGFFAGGNPSGGWLATYYEWMHEKPTLGGYVNRARDVGWTVEQPGLLYPLACPLCPPSEDDLNPDVVRSFFRQHRIKYVILHKLTPYGEGLAYVGEAELTLMDGYLRDVVGATPIYSDPILTVYRNQDLE